MYGNFSEESIAKVTEILDFARCQRPDGTYYGTAGKCRKGKLTGAKAAPVKKEASPPKAKPAKKVKAKAKAKPEAKKETPLVEPAPVKKTKQVKKTTAKPPAPKSKPKAEPKEAQLLKKYQDLAKKQQKLVDAGKFKEAVKINKEVNKAYYAWEKVSKSKKETEKKLVSATKEKSEEQKKFQATLNKLNERQRSVYSSLNAKDFAAIKDYTDDGGNRPFSKLNSCLRKPICLDRGVRSHASELDKALKKMPANTDGDTFYRGVHVNTPQSRKLYQSLSRAKPGTKIKDPGFSSYSLDKKVTDDFIGYGKNILFVSRSKELRPINLYSSITEEHEAILPRGTRSTIRSVREEGNTLIVELD